MRARFCHCQAILCHILSPFALREDTKDCAQGREMTEGAGEGSSDTRISVGHPHIFLSRFVHFFLHYTRTSEQRGVHNITHYAHALISVRERVVRRERFGETNRDTESVKGFARL